ncbi:hypothetical protein EQO05_14680 [Methanosarcina sp. MSH10X1]|uniref:hypothetical protein n=1 Tax=Methanosarcina sp. MSH10X1 TaxID=2507075 RepID=UPI000FFCBE1A|nr:hypothetical protein [Methanosarcina sp. MSH10X1]RXA15654.1 hypothetical protein EQO05_14680 [Methanosarcina sp. MSH10X1]
MRIKDEGCLESKEAYEYLFKYGELPLHLPDNFDLWVERMKQSEHSEDYINQRIKLVKYLYCKHAKSDILLAYSRDKVRVEYDKLTEKEEDEAIRIVKEAKELLNKTRDIDKYHQEGNHWLENKTTLNNYITYLSAVYKIPTHIMQDNYKKQKKWWKLR